MRETRDSRGITLSHVSPTRVRWRGDTRQNIHIFLNTLRKCYFKSAVLSVGLATNLPEVFTITEKGPTRAFSLLKLPKNQLRHYDVQALKHGKLM